MNQVGIESDVKVYVFHCGVGHVVVVAVCFLLFPVSFAVAFAFDFYTYLFNLIGIARKAIRLKMLCSNVERFYSFMANFRLYTILCCCFYFHLHLHLHCSVVIHIVVIIIIEYINYYYYFIIVVTLTFYSIICRVL